MDEMQKNLTDLAEGTFRSLNGAADENIFIGKASKAGFYTFFKVWRDMPYDAVLDYDGILYRIEIKGSGTGKFNVTHGGRSGGQIDRNAEDRTHLLSRNDGDFVVGVDTDNGDCYIIPMDVVVLCNRQNMSIQLVNDFKEKWQLFLHGEGRLNGHETRDGLMQLELPELISIAERLGIKSEECTQPLHMDGPRSRMDFDDPKKAAILRIWLKLADIS